MQDIYGCPSARCAALYCCIKCADTDKNAGMHPPECGKLDMPEMFLHRVAMRSQHKELAGMILSRTKKGFVNCAEELLQKADEDNTAFATAVWKWASYRNEKGLMKKCKEVRSNLRSKVANNKESKAQSDKLPDWGTLCKGLEKERTQAFIITKGKSDDFMQRLENVLGEFYYFVFFKLFLSLNFSFV